MTRQMVYRYDAPEAVTPDDTAGVKNVEGAWSIFVTVSGNVCFRLRDATTVTIPVLAGSSFELGYSMLNIMSTGTTATGIFKCV